MANWSNWTVAVARKTQYNKFATLYLKLNRFKNAVSNLVPRAAAS